jgi:hypothetical protein
MKISQKSFLTEPKRMDPTFLLAELYEKRSDAYLKKGNWHRAFREFQRIMNGFPDYGPIVERWREIGRATDRRHYIDLKTFDDARSDSIKLWIKETRGLDDSGGPYSLLRFELNCSARRMRTLSFASYDVSGDLTASREGTMIWQAIIRESLGETLGGFKWPTHN